VSSGSSPTRSASRQWPSARLLSTVVPVEATEPPFFLNLPRRLLIRGSRLGQVDFEGGQPCPSRPRNEPLRRRYSLPFRQLRRSSRTGERSARAPVRKRFCTGRWAGEISGAAKWQGGDDHPGAVTLTGGAGPDGVGVIIAPCPRRDARVHWQQHSDFARQRDRGETGAAWAESGGITRRIVAGRSGGRPNHEEGDIFLPDTRRSFPPPSVSLGPSEAFLRRERAARRGTPCGALRRAR
jgi:hypothetical protein